MPHTEFAPGQPRSAGAIPQRRVPQPWPKDRRFRILSLDSGGIRGVFPATVLAMLERRFAGARGIGGYFDLVAGTSTGGIIALGIGAGLPAEQIRDLYVLRGNEIFPEHARSPVGRLRSLLSRGLHWFHYRYDREAISRLLSETLGNRLLGESKVRLCIPAFDGKYSEVFVYKTPHHSDYKFDRYERMATVALATSAAPSFFQPLKQGGYQLVDGGLWANNPIMLAVIEALICFDLDPRQIDVLSISCGEDPYFVSAWQEKWGGKLFWSTAIFAAMRLQSLAATNQARLLLGPQSVHRVAPTPHQPPIDLDDWGRAVELLEPDALTAVDSHGEALRTVFFSTPAEEYTPVPEQRPAGG